MNYYLLNEKFDFQYFNVKHSIVQCDVFFVNVSFLKSIRASSHLDEIFYKVFKASLIGDVVVGKRFRRFLIANVILQKSIRHRASAQLKMQKGIRQILFAFFRMRILLVVRIKKKTSVFD